MTFKELWRMNEPDGVMYMLVTDWKGKPLYTGKFARWGTAGWTMKALWREIMRDLKSYRSKHDKDA